MFWENILRVSNACKGVLECLWIESRIKNAANGGVCLGVVTAMGVAVHRPGLANDRLAKAEKRWCWCWGWHRHCSGGTATPRAVPT